MSKTETIRSGNSIFSAFPLPTLSFSSSKDTVLLPSTVEKIKIDSVLENSLPEPFTKENFRSFLVSELAEENLDFYESVQTYRLAYSTQQRKGTRSNVETHQIKLQTAIAEEYIEEDAPKQVNISSALRNKILNMINTRINPNVFDEAITEIKTLMALGPFARFILTVRTKNLSPKNAEYRKQAGLQYVIIGIILFFIIWFVQIFSQTESKFLKSQFLRLLILPFVVNGIGLYIAGSRCLCPMLADHGVYMGAKEKMSWKLEYFPMFYTKKAMQEEKNTRKIEDESVVKLHKKLGRKVVFQAIILGTLVAFILALLPPGEIYKDVQFNNDKFNY